MMRVVPSTHHQLLKHPTPTGMANIRGNYAMVRTISAIARKKSCLMAKTSRTVSDKEPSADKKQKEDC